MRFAAIATLFAFLAGQAIAGKWLRLHPAVLKIWRYIYENFSTTNTSMFTVPVKGNNNKAAAASSAEGQACTQSIEGSVADGTCNYIGQCVVQSPPNLEQRFKNDQCA